MILPALRPLLIAICVLLGTGCGSAVGGSDTTSGGSDTTLSVTRDFGAQNLSAQTSVPLTAGLTVMRQLQKTHETDEAYGGRYVSAIDGLAEDSTDSWLFYVDGVEAPVGAGSTRLRAGQSVQWDFHAWQNVRTGGAIVGSWPRPLDERGVRLVCLPVTTPACKVVRDALDAAGIAFGVATEHRRTHGNPPVDLLVGSWRDLRSRGGLPRLDRDGASNGAFAEFSSDGSQLTPVDAAGESASPLGAGTGLLAAFADGKRLRWLITGTDSVGVERAAELLAEPKELAERFGLMVSADAVTPLPLAAGAKQ